jgi:hypothetical protein
MLLPWLERIDAARVCRGFTAGDRVDAAQWATCAVGEQRRAHPDIVRYSPTPTSVDIPEDPVLVNLGTCFLRAVERNDVADAEHFFLAISDRVLQLKREFAG